MDTCTRPHCTLTRVARGLCAGHYQKARRAGVLQPAVKSNAPLIDSAGTRRRFRDLMLQGHSASILSDALGIQRTEGQFIHNGRRLRVRADLAERIRKLHLAREGTWGGSLRTANWASAQGYQRIDRYVEPDNPRSHLVDHVSGTPEEVDHLISFGWDDQDIAKRLGFTLGYVKGIRQTLEEAHRG